MKRSRAIPSSMARANARQNRNAAVGSLVGIVPGSAVVFKFTGVGDSIDDDVSCRYGKDFVMPVPFVGDATALDQDISSG